MAVQTRHTVDLDPATVARDLRAAHAAGGADAVGLPRRPRADERVDTARRGDRTTYSYRRDTSLACWHVLVVVPVPTPGCDDADVYIVERGELVAARARRYPLYGVFCALPLLLASKKGLDPCFAVWGEESWRARRAGAGPG